MHYLENLQSQQQNNNIRTVADEDSDFTDSDEDIGEEDSEYDTAESDAVSNADENTNQPDTCNCRKKDKANCPLKGNCLVCCLVCIVAEDCHVTMIWNILYKYTEANVTWVESYYIVEDKNYLVSDT